MPQALGPSQCRWLVLSFSPATGCSRRFSREQLVQPWSPTGKPVSYCDVQTDCGHDAFLLPNELAVYGDMTEAFLSNLHAGQSNRARATTRTPASTMTARTATSTSIFRHQRLDYDSIVAIVPPGASVLDLGCGTGGLLARLRQQGHRRSWASRSTNGDPGVRPPRPGRRSLDLNLGLGVFADGQFDCVILSQTLQAVSDVKRVLAEMLRVGRQGIVSFPNLAYSRVASRVSRTWPGAASRSRRRIPLVRHTQCAVVLASPILSSCVPRNESALISGLR